jgi:uncharacterized protein YyaL (SSP411 family)
MEIYLPNIQMACSTTESELPLLKNRLKKDQTLIYVCSESECKPPVELIDEAIKLIRANQNYNQKKIL